MRSKNKSIKQQKPNFMVQKYGMLINICSLLKMTRVDNNNKMIHSKPEPCPHVSRHSALLSCHCEKTFSVPPESIWNAASFYQESSYLYFPTLQAELASDISFYFKTSTPSGVFLENQGLKDFIRVELSCE